jgi:hypothetical protein
MSRKRTLYPACNKAIYAARDTLDAFLNKAIDNAQITDPELTALRNIHTALTSNTGTTLPRYKELS